MHEEPFDADYFRKYKTILKKNEVEKSYKGIKSGNSEFARFLKTVTKKEALKCKVMRAFSFIRTDRIDQWKKHCYLMYPFIKYLCAKISAKLGTRDGSMLFRDEIIALLEGKNPVTANDLVERGKRKDLILLYDKAGCRFMRDDKLKKYLVDAYKKNSASQDVKGICAQKGVARGPVRIYLNEGDIGHDEKDYILVCRHTTPADLPVMKRAKAIVADEGGITCHAAIVSRELKIPCIVGCKNGTHMLKDGDRVEVDADKGVVNILS
jgi:phosphoenolpyruvate synthase/pyruvate phosphate dikinase